MGRVWNWWTAAHLTRSEKRREALQGLALGVAIIVVLRIVVWII